MQPPNHFINKKFNRWNTPNSFPVFPLPGPAPRTGVSRSTRPLKARGAHRTHRAPHGTVCGPGLFLLMLTFHVNLQKLEAFRDAILTCVLEDDLWLPQHVWLCFLSAPFPSPIHVLCLFPVHPGQGKAQWRETLHCFTRRGILRSATMLPKCINTSRGLLKSICVLQRNESAQRHFSSMSQTHFSEVRHNSWPLQVPHKWFTAAVAQTPKSFMVFFEIHSWVEGGTETAKATSLILEFIFKLNIHWAPTTRKVLY